MNDAETQPTVEHSRLQSDASWLSHLRERGVLREVVEHEVNRAAGRKAATPGREASRAAEARSRDDGVGAEAV